MDEKLPDLEKNETKYTPGAKKSGYLQKNGATIAGLDFGKMPDLFMSFS